MYFTHVYTAYIEMLFRSFSSEELKENVERPKAETGQSMPMDLAVLHCSLWGSFQDRSQKRTVCNLSLRKQLVCLQRHTTPGLSLSLEAVLFSGLFYSMCMDVLPEFLYHVVPEVRSRHLISKNQRSESYEMQVPGTKPGSSRRAVRAFKQQPPVYPVRPLWYSCL